MRKVIAKLKVYRLVAWTLALLMLSGYIPQGIQRKKTNLFKNIDTVQAATTLKNPRIVKDISMDAGQKVTWDCVWFGSYPQSEVTAADGSIYDTLKNATGWDGNNDIMIEGTKYRRLKGEDATRVPDDWEEAYDWNGSYTTYHYFKYEPVKWRVLHTDGEKALLLADVALDDQRYNTNYTDVTWENSSIRSWLNGYKASVNEPRIDYTSKNFLNAAFSESERKSIKTTNVFNNKNNSFGINGGNNTLDKVFLLSTSEAFTEKYGFAPDTGETEEESVDEARQNQCSTYAYAMGTWRDADEEEPQYSGNIYWWLRSPSFGNDFAAVVSAAGCVYNSEIDYVSDDVNGIRPALYLNLSASGIYSYAGTVCSDGKINEVEYDGNKKDDESYGYKDYTDYDSDVENFINNKGTQGTIRYLCTNENFPNSIFVCKNDATFASNVSMFVSDVVYRGMDGWKDLCNSKTSIEEAEKTIAALVQEYEPQVKDLASKKTLQKYASAFVAGLKDYIRENSIRDNIDNKDIKTLESLVTEKEVEKLFLQGDYNKLCKYFKEQGGYSENSAIVKSLNKYATSKKLADNLSNIVDMGGTAIKVMEISNDTLNYYCQLESIIQADIMYSEMLTYIKNNCQFDVVKQAAQNLCDVIQGGWQKQLEYVSTALKNEAEKETVDLVIKQAVKASPWLEVLKASYDWGVDLSNTFLNIEDIQKQKDNMRIIAYLGDALKKWVLENQTIYLNSEKDGVSIKGKNIRAKRLYYSMYMLWKTRIVGEKALQTMMQKSYSKRSKYYMISVQTLCTLNSQKQVMFTPEMVKKFISVSVACPVDVEVYDQNEKLLLKVKDGKESSGVQNGIYYYVQYNALDNDYTKILCYPEGTTYTLKYIGKDSGRVDSMIMETEEDGRTKNKFFDNVPVEKGSSIIVKRDSEQNYSYKTTDVISGEENEKLFNTGMENKYIDIQKLMFSSESFRVNKGDEKLLTLNVFPENATNQKLIWESSDNSIARVNSDGVVHGEKEGTVVIKVYSLADEVTAVCTVQVASKKQNSENKEGDAGRIKINRIQLKGISNKIAASKNLKLTAVITPTTASNKKLKWKSSNTKVASVSQRGIVTMAKKSGGKKVIITAIANDGSGVVASWKITSMKGIVKKVKVKGTTKTKAGKSVKLKVSVKATKGANKKLLWTSSNAKYATVNAKGVVKTKKAGKGKKVKVTAMATDGSGKKSSITIKIK